MREGARSIWQKPLLFVESDMTGTRQRKFHYPIFGIIKKIEPCLSDRGLVLAKHYPGCCSLPNIIHRRRRGCPKDVFSQNI